MRKLHRRVPRCFVACQTQTAMPRLTGTRNAGVFITSNQTQFCVSTISLKRRSVNRGRRYGLTGKEFRSLKRQQAPDVLFIILAAMRRIQGRIEPHLDGIEYFAGASTIQSQMLAHGYCCLAYDICNDHKHQDILSPSGFLTALSWALSLRELSMTHWATVCSSWVWLSRSQSMRSELHPLGDESYDWVCKANIMVSRMALIWMVLQMRRCLYILEQPSSSVMWAHPRLIAWPRLMSTHTWMGCFMAPTCKPTRLWSTAPCVLQKLTRQMDAQTRKRCSSDEVVSINYNAHTVHGMTVTGGSRLKETQEYTPQYAKAVVDAYFDWKAAQQRPSDESESESDYQDDGGDPWDDLNLKEVLALLDKP